MKRDPLPAHPDNADLGRAIVQVEECVHDTGERHRREIEKLRKTVARTNTRLARHEKQMAGVRKVVGVNDEGEIIRQSPMLMGRLSFVSTLGGVAFALFLVVQLGNALWPSISLGAVELWRFVLQLPLVGAPPSH